MNLCIWEIQKKNLGLEIELKDQKKNITFTENGKKAILNKIIQAEGFEKYLHVKFVGTKRFGLDGGESLIPALEQIIKRGGNLGAKEIKIGMPHRGRLNVLANVMGKPFKAIFSEFFGKTVSTKKILKEMLNII